MVSMPIQNLMSKFLNSKLIISSLTLALLITLTNMMFAYQLNPFE